MKTKTLLIAAVMFLSISVAAFAQAQYSVSASPETTRVSTGYTEKVGDIGFNTIQASNVTVTGTITIEYGRTITTYPLTNIKVTAYVDPQDALNFGATPPTLAATVEDGQQDSSQVVITITPAVTDPARIYSFRLSGVRVDVHGGGSGVAPIDAVVTATQNMIVNGQATARVLNAVQLPFDSFIALNPVTINALTGLPGGGTFTLDATEMFRAALGVTVATDNTQNTVQTLIITLDNSIPSGVTVTFPATDSAAKWTLTSGGTFTSATVGTPTAVYTLTADTNINEIEHVLFPVTVVANAPTTVLYDPDYVVHASITLGPLHVANSTQVPRYAPAYLTSGPLFSFVAAYDQTVLMIPYATTAAGYNTGIAIANTTLDPGVGATKFTSPLQQTGKIRFYFFPNSDADMFVVDSNVDKADLPSFDWGSDGMVPPGKSYILLISQLLDVAKANGDFDGEFSGYIIVVCDFTHAHGQYFISDFGDFTNGALMLVMNPADASRAISVPESFGN